MQPGVEQRPAAPLLGAGAELCLAQLQAVPDGDVADAAALGDEHDRDLGPRAAAEPGRPRRRVRAGLQAGEPARVPVGGHRQPPVTRYREARQPLQVGADHVGAEQAQQAGLKLGRAGGDAVAFEPCGGPGVPARAEGVPRAGMPALLPGLPGKALQPAQQLPRPAPPGLPGGGPGGQPRRLAEHGGDLGSAGGGDWPRAGHLPGGELAAQRLGRLSRKRAGRALPARRGPGGGLHHGGHERPPNRLASEPGL